MTRASPSRWRTRSTSRPSPPFARFTGLRVEPVLAYEQEILDAVDKYFGESAERGSATADFVAGDAQAAEDLEHLRDMASEAPVIRLVNHIIAQAVEKRASDIHIEPFEKEFRIRYRVDGVLYPQEQPPRELKAAIISRVKLMAKLNIAERRLPQDGRIKVKTLGREVDLRVSTLPTLYGESVVMRLLDRSAGDFYSLERLGFDKYMLGRMQYYTSLPHGIFLVTGPPAAASPRHSTRPEAHQQSRQEDHHHRRSGRVSDGRDQPASRQPADRTHVRLGHPPHRPPGS
jgi:general secretion pathway protein E